MGIRRRKFGLTKKLIRHLAAGIVATTSFVIVYLLLTQKAVLVPSNHTFQSLNSLQKQELLQRLDRELGKGNYNIHAPKPLPGFEKLGLSFDYFLNTKRKQSINENMRIIHDDIFHPTSDSHPNPNSAPASESTLSSSKPAPMVDPTLRSAALGFSRIY
ncbi:hypothetical protein AYI68_g7998, partial [Smittium mucronatum]